MAPIAGWPQRGPAEAWRARPYTQLLRGPNYAWWRPVVSVLLAVAVGFGLMTVFWGALAAGWAVARGGSPSDAEYAAWTTGPIGLLFVNLVLASMILVAQAAVWGGYGWRPRWVASVAGGLRWPWLIRGTVLALALMLLVNAALVVLDGGLAIRPDRRAASFALVVLLTTPLQAAGEEFLFRGWLSQLVGSVFARAGLGAVVAAVVSGLVFAWAHGQQDPWLFADRFVFALAASWLVWRTGGLEASIAVHAANNVLSFALAVLTGQVSQMLTATDADAMMFVVDLGIIVVNTLAIDRLARRYGMPRLFHPPLRSW
jgi:hypothetical protein